MPISRKVFAVFPATASNPVTRPLAGSQTGRAPISASAWAMSSPPVRMLAVPQAESASARRIVAVLLGVALDQQPGGMPAELPGRRGRHRAGIDRIEIAPGRQHLGPAAARRAARARAARSGRRAPARMPAISAVAAGGDRGAQHALDPAEHGAGLVPVRLRLALRRRSAAAPELPAARPYRPAVRQP